MVLVFSIFATLDSSSSRSSASASRRRSSSTRPSSAACCCPPRCRCSANGTGTCRAGSSGCRTGTAPRRPVEPSRRSRPARRPMGRQASPPPLRAADRDGRRRETDAGPGRARDRTRPEGLRAHRLGRARRGTVAPRPGPAPPRDERPGHLRLRRRQTQSCEAGRGGGRRGQHGHRLRAPVPQRRRSPLRPRVAAPSARPWTLVPFSRRYVNFSLGVSSRVTRSSRGPSARPGSRSRPATPRWSRSRARCG